MKYEWAPLVTIPLYLIAALFALPHLINCHGYIITLFGILSTAAVLVPAQVGIILSAIEITKIILVA